MALPEAPPWTETEQLAFEKETLGLYWSGHPVDRYASELKEFGARSTGELAQMPATGARGDAWGPGGPKPIEPDTSVGGIVAACRQLKTRKGDRMAVFTLEDAQGGVEVIAFPEAYQRAASLIETGHDGARPRQAGARRRVGAGPGVGDRADRERARTAGAGGGHPPDGCRPAAACSRRSARSSRDTAGDRRVSFEIELPGDSTRLRVKADVSSQIRVRPSSSAHRGSRAGRRAGSGVAAMMSSSRRSALSFAAHRTLQADSRR